MKIRLLLLVAVLLGMAAVARADTYDELVDRAGAAADKERWADCARLYDQAIQAFPPNGSRPHSELPILRDNRDACQKRKPVPPPPPLVSLKLSMNVPALFGRQEELKALDEAWGGPKRRRVVAVVAMGGQGKTTLVVNWLLHMNAAAYRGARRVFAWSFYHQGTGAGQAGSSDEFLAAALRFFGDKEPDQGTPFQKADRLRDRVRQQRSLLVLDGLEPLQYPPGALEGEGVLRDGALASLLTNLAADNPGLVVVTSRIKLGDLTAFENSALLTLPLHPFSESEGAALLRSLGVQGTHDELAAAVREAQGLPLSLVLLGNLLHDACGGDVRRRGEIAALKPGAAQGVHAQHVMNGYDRWFKGDAERTVLRLVGLFDRPAAGAALKALRAEPKVAGLNQGLVGLSDAAWNQALTRLRRAGLVERKNEADPGAVDAHPLVREHFGEVLRRENEAAWREGHGRLYRWYSGTAKALPDTAEEMQPLFAAMTHGGRAGRHQEALREVFWRRIRRYGEHYSTRKLGAYGAELSALSGFFETMWTQPIATLRERDRAFVLNGAGFALSALGRLEEAAEPLRAGLEANRALQDWTNAARAAGNLSELQLALGQVKQAAASAQEAVELADRSGDVFQRLTTRATLAEALHQGGQTEEARLRFVEAEQMQPDLEPESPLLYSLLGFQYCDLLLSQGAVDEVLRRAEQSLPWATAFRVPQKIGLDHLMLGRARAARLAAGHKAEATLAREHLNQAVVRLREGAEQTYIAAGLLYRAAFFRQTGDFPSAGRDLEEALLLATRGPMRLRLADIHLERARLFQAQHRIPQARGALAMAKALIEQTGYARRTTEADLLARQLGGK